MARVALINPPSATVGKNSKHRQSRVLATIPPYGIAMLAACLEVKGHKVRVWDLVASPTTDEMFVAELVAWSPDVVGISVLGPAFYWLRQIAPIVRRAMPAAKLLVGNALASEYPAWFLNQIPEIDAIAVGESEISVPAWIDAGTPTHFPGIVTHDHVNPTPPALAADLDSLPLPAWHLLPVERYRSSPQFLSGRKAFLPLIQSRGCPWSCHFCAQNYAWKSVRYRSIESIAEEMHKLYVDHKTEMFGFLDSIFPLKPQFGEELYRALESRKLIGKFTLGNETRVDMVWPDTYTYLAKAGLRFTLLGIESASAEVLAGQDKVKKMYSVDKTLRILKDRNIRSYGLFVIGLPGETLTQREATERLMLSLPLDMASVGVYTIYAGSPAARAQQLDPESLLSVNFAYDLDRDSLGYWQRRMMRKFFLRPSFIARHLMRGDIHLADMIQGGMLLLSK